MRRLTLEQARSIAVRAQLLSGPVTVRDPGDQAISEPLDLVGVVRHLTHIQADPVTVVAPSAELVLRARLGDAFRPDHLDQACVAGQLIDLRGDLIPAEDIALHRAEMDAWPFTGPRREWQQHQFDWVTANDDTRREILRMLRLEGALPGSSFPDTTVVPWRSSGWNADRNIRMLLSLMELRGEVATAGWEGRERLWDLAERVHPDVETVPLEEAFRLRGERRLRALGIDRRRVTTMPGLQLGADVDTAGEPATIDGAPGRWRVDPAYLEGGDVGAGDVDGGGAEPRCVLLSPLDRLVFDRDRMERLFGFDYQLEMFKPAAQRRWGYWAMPILHGHELIGKLDATADREAGTLFVDAIHEDHRWTTQVRADVEAQVEALADWLGLTVTRP